MGDDAEDGLRINAPVFLALSATLGTGQTFGSCTVYPSLPFGLVLPSASNSFGLARVSLPIPLNSALSGVTVIGQGGAVDASGALLGVASLSPGLRIRIGS